ncbi:MAG: hypothetical protein AB7P03_28870, partial [Kofleriaceae bacterium]
KKIHTARDTLETSGGNADHAVKFAQLGIAYAIELAKGQLDHPDRLAQPPSPMLECGYVPTQAPDEGDQSPFAAIGSLLLLGVAAWLTARLR